MPRGHCNSSSRCETGHDLNGSLRIAENVCSKWPLHSNIDQLQHALPVLTFAVQLISAPHGVPDVSEGSDDGPVGV